MKFSVKAICVAGLLLLMAFAAGCQKTPYEINDSENYNVSVKFDANGGVFTHDTPVMVDSYNISQMKKDDSGYVHIPLLRTDDPARGGNDAHAPTKPGYFLAGWYQTCNVTTDEQGNETYTYADPWDFATDRVAVDAAKSYTAKEPVLTLYAAWVPAYDIEYYDLTSGKMIESRKYSPVEESEIQLPQWDTETGTIKMYKFPEKDDYTLQNVYLDAEGNQAVTEATITHHAVLDPATATATNTVMKFYLDWAEGNWYQIYDAQQFIKNYSPSGRYNICADLDFTGKIWPSSAVSGTFNGIILGNGHIISNVNIQRTEDKAVTGLFGKLGETAEVSDLQLQNVTLTVKNGTRKGGTAIGLLAGTISETAKVSNLTITQGLLQIDTAARFDTEDYIIGLVCGLGQTDIDYSDITCIATGENPESIVITVTDATVTVDKAPATTETAEPAA